jgi:glycosyltransferase involved in cell wall biosynthesis
MSQTPTASKPARHRNNRPRQAVAVLHVINGEHYAGAERVQDLLAQNLGGLGFQAGFACLKRGQFARLRQARDVPLYELPMQSRFDLRPAWDLARLVRRQGYGLLHSHTARSALIAGLASAMTGVPLVHHVHSPASRDTTDGLRNRINALAERAVLGRARALIAVSESLGRYIRGQGFAADRVFVVRNGVPCRPAVPRRNPAKSTWTIGTIALVRPRKGLEILLAALAALRGQGLPVRLRVAGSFETPEYEGRIEQLEQDLRLAGAIDWAGFTPDVDRELAQMDLFVLPSLFGEGLPMVLLEAMSAGVPIVASRVEGVPEAVTDGREGLLVSPGDPRGLAQAIRRFISGEADWQAIAERARRRHAEQFSDSRMAAGVAEVYRHVLEGDLGI